MFFIQVSWYGFLAFPREQTGPPQWSVMEEQMVMEIWVPLSHPWSGVRKWESREWSGSVHTSVPYLHLRAMCWPLPEAGDGAVLWALFSSPGSWGVHRDTSEVQSLSCCWDGHSRSTQVRGRDYRKGEVLGSKEHDVSIVEVLGSGRIAKDFSGIPGFLYKKVNKLYLLSLE